MEFKGIKIHRTTSSGDEVKLTVPRCKILQHVKNPYTMKEILVRKIHSHFSPSEISSSHGGEYDVQNCLLGYTAVQNDCRPTHP
jgi:hypothetical protein